MTRHSGPLLALILAGPVACAPSPDHGAMAQADAPLWQFSEAAEPLMAASCPDDRPFTRPAPFPLSVTPLDLSGIDTQHRLMGWALDSDHPGFGGLSGLAVMASGTLLAVSDAGGFIWLTMESGTPTGEGYHAEMLDEIGETLSGKTRADAEGLALRDGIAFVSFEHDHRILAFDLEGCGAAPLGIPIAEVGETPTGLSRSMRQNGGLEGLTLLPDGTLAAAIETRDPDIPYGRLRSGGSLVIDAQIPTFNAQAGTGIDGVGDTLLTVHRDFRRGDGNYITLSQTPLANGLPAGETVPLLRLTPQDTVDNFEAVAAVPSSDGTLSRVYLLSDDNFSGRQRTLLFAMDLPRR